MSIAALPVRRGCGSRKEGGVYLECGLAVGGRPIEDFIFDPPLDEERLPIEWLKPSRTPQLFEREGVNHVVIWVGEDFYPNVFDFIEETRVAGASRRVPKTFDFSKLTASSRMYFVHAHAAVDGTALIGACNGGDDVAELPCPRLSPIDAIVPVRKHSLRADASAELLDESRHCLGLAKYLPVSDPHDYVTSEPQQGTYRTRTLPCGHSYELAAVPTVPLTSKPAMFLMLPLTGIACINHDDGSLDEAVETRVREAAVDVYRTEQ